MRTKPMMRAYALVAVTIAVTGCAPSLSNPAACTPGVFSDLAVPLRAQETPMWCWAASGQMVMDYLGVNVAQCTQANDRFGVSNCPCNQCGPNPQGSPPCVNGGWPDFNRYGFDFVRTTNTAVSWAILQRELSRSQTCGDRPIAFSWAWSGGGGHLMVAVGYSTVAGTHFVSIQDPWTPCQGDARILTYAAYVEASGYTHWDDFYEIRRTP